MQVEFFTPSEFDASSVLSVENNTVAIDPRFYTSKGSATVGILVVTNQRGHVCDRAKVIVNGHGKLSLTKLSNPVPPIADQVVTED